MPKPLSVHRIKHWMLRDRVNIAVVGCGGTGAALVTGLPYLDLYEDRWVCIVDDGHPDVGDTLTLPQLGELPWVALFNGPTAFAAASRQLRMLGVEARVDVVVDGFLQMPFLVAGTRRVALIQERLARRLAPVAGVRILPCPFDVVPVAEAFWWNPVHRNDPAHVWLREMLSEAVADLRHQPG